MQQNQNLSLDRVNDLFTRVFDSPAEQSYRSYKQCRNNNHSADDLKTIDPMGLMEKRYQEEKSCQQN